MTVNMNKHIFLDKQKIEIKIFIENYVDQSMLKTDIMIRLFYHAVVVFCFFWTYENNVVVVRFTFLCILLKYSANF